MNTRLALDLGSSSIGWALFRLNDDSRPCAIIRSGVRIFSDGRDNYQNSLGARRRKKRLERRMRARRNKRVRTLARWLITLGFLPSDPVERRLLMNELDPYELRSRGVREELTRFEFGRAVFHLGKRRAFKSNRKTDTEDEKESNMKSAITTLEGELQKSGTTLGDWMYQQRKKDSSFSLRFRPNSSSSASKLDYDYYASRAMVEDEFRTLWIEQKKRSTHPEDFSDWAFDRIFDAIFFQRPLKPVVPGLCTLIPEERRAPKALPSFQRFRLYQELNHVRLVSADGARRPLSLGERDKLALYLENHKTLNILSIPRKLKLKDGSQAINLSGEDGSKKELTGNRTACDLRGNGKSKPGFGVAWDNFSDARQEEITKKLLNETDAESLSGWLVRNTGVSPDLAHTISERSLESGYSRVSEKAISLVLPKLMESVIPYSKAVEESEIGSHSGLSHYEKTGVLLEELPYYGEYLQRRTDGGTGDPRETNPEIRFGKIGNPSVHVALNQLRKVVNELVREYGRPTEINVEVLRDLRHGRKTKKKIHLANLENQKENQRRVEEALPFLGVKKVKSLSDHKRSSVARKMRLWEDLAKNPGDRRCPYTGTLIEPQMFLKTGEVEIDHILPLSDTWDNTLSNLTLCTREANRKKGKQTPYEAFGHIDEGPYSYASIKKRVKSIRDPEKRRRFLENALDVWKEDHSGPSSRALTDSSYIARVAVEYLSLICPREKVIPVSGRITSQIRKRFNFKKGRHDHRHHALDAIALGIADHRLVQQSARTSREADGRYMSLAKFIREPWPTYEEHAERAIRNIVVSFRPDHGHQGQIHKESHWGLRGDGSAKRKGANKPKTPNDVTRMMSISKSSDPLRIHTGSPAKSGTAYKFMETNSNYCLEITVNAKGKWSGEVISRAKSYEFMRDHPGGNIMDVLPKNKGINGRPLVMRLTQGDMVRIHVDGNKHIMRVNKMGWNGSVFLSEHFESNCDQRNRGKAEPGFRYLTKSASGLQAANCEWISVSPAGRTSSRWHAAA
ncbi:MULTISPECIES: type II CRISPR RNA-guided endonuclease Cas9 [unclassified Thioalkalivibrio]|uniref:type II CRISPR RNA-guided endonuclease Cas9 n=1 Tax=unclassified Thioalkalivibrio TaxID=2621013 RepID=UPI0018CB8E5F|nr:MULTISPECIES: type II CRISPR RNA-guided endonuclease Cas9 [unclassified Thioalkalivibrio]